MIEDIAREIIHCLLGGAMLWAWATFKTFVAPVMLDRCPWAQDCEGPL